MHSAAFLAAGIDGSYLAHDCASDDLGTALSEFRAAGYRGLNVTVPHKESVMAFCDSVEPSALRLGAVNTVTFLPERTVGSNTDLPGFMGSLAAQLDFQPSGRRVLVIGAGGSARAVVCGLCDGGADVYVTNRTFGRAVALCDGLGGTPLEYDRQILNALDPDLVVNTTSVGMKATPGSAEWAAAEVFFDRLGDWSSVPAYDLIYTPERTPFLSRFDRGAHGLDMLIRQGALSFQRWTGVPLNRVLPAMRSGLSADPQGPLGR
ncbi:MAG: shikimate dehydrogenase [Myxococcota bacterium]|jgi:shikimate dehydrogenase